MALILILDDRATNRNIYARLAAAIEPGIVTEVFADPLDALEWLQSNRVDLVITDYRMPGMDGAEFTRRFRAMPDGALAPVMVVTAYDDRSFRLRALDAGATDFLQTPIDHFELVTRARNLLALGRQAAPQPSGPLPSPARSLAPRPPAERSAAQRLGADMQPPGSLTDPPQDAVVTTAPNLPAPNLPASVSSAGDLALILDHLPALVSVADRSGICLYANATLAGWLGRPAASLIGRPASLLRAPETAARNRRDDLAVFETGLALPARQETAADPDGLPRSIITVKTPLRDAAGGTLAVLTFAYVLPNPSERDAAEADKGVGGGLADPSAPPRPGPPRPEPPWGVADD